MVLGKNRGEVGSDFLWTGGGRRERNESHFQGSSSGKNIHTQRSSVTYDKVAA